MPKLISGQPIYTDSTQPAIVVSNGRQPIPGVRPPVATTTHQQGIDIYLATGRLKIGGKYRLFGHQVSNVLTGKRK